MTTPDSRIVVGIGGRAGAGKDTLADLMVRELGFVKLPFADGIKKMLNAAFGWHPDAWLNRDWKEQVIPALGKSPRELAQTLGTEWGREMVHEDVWVKSVQSQPGFWNPRVVISDVRFPNEVDFIHRNGGKVIYVTRPGISAVAAHKSETYDLYNAADVVVNNNQTPADMLAFVKEYLHV